MIGKEGKLQLR
jgi:hypothetical protein